MKFLLSPGTKDVPLCPDLFTFETEFNFANRFSPQTLHLLFVGVFKFVYFFVWGWMLGGVWGWFVGFFW